MSGIFFNYKNVRTFIFDLDGTVWNWTSLFPNMRETISKLRARGRKVYFISDNTILSRKGLAEKLSEMGIPAEEKELITSSYVAARFFSENKIKNVYVLGEKGLIDEFGNFKISISDKADKSEAVLSSVDRNLTFWKLKTACDLIRGGAKLFSTGSAPCWHINGDTLPGELPTLRAIEAATGTAAIQLGKPSDYMKKIVLEQLFLFPEDTLFIGDDIKTDVPFAHKCGFKSAVVLHGLTTMQKAVSSQGAERPDAIINDIKELIANI